MKIERMEEKGKKSKKGAEARDILLAIILFALFVAVIITLWTDALLTTFMILLVWVASLCFWHDKKDMLVFVLGAVLGPLTEIICIQFSIWSYASPNMLGIPAWLVIGWGLAVLLISKASQSIVTWRGWK